MTENAIATNNGSALALFGRRDDIRELGDRLVKLMPGGQSLTSSEALAVAQVAVAHNLDPFNGEVWGLKSKDGKWYGVTIGIKGLRKKARDQAASESTTFWTELVLVDPAKYNADKSAIVYECILRDTVTMQAWGKSINILTTGGVPYKEAIEMLGKAPQVVGFGVATPNERSKMGIHERARKRAEAAAIKQRFDVKFGSGVIEDEVADGAILEGEIVPQADEVQEAQPPAVRRDEAVIQQELGFS